MARELPGDANYVVTAPLVVVRTAKGYQHLYDGQRLPAGVDPVQMRSLIDGGMIAPIQTGGAS
ncbi:hypothetical protein [Intrasporangium chromatireducens]|nr:hypothetical protein [Intrasporangium chromatireducens]